MAHHRDAAQLDPFVPFTCSGCNVRFSTPKQLDAKPPSEADRKALQLKHEGQRYGSPPLFPIEPALMIVCILHVMLRLIDNLFAHTVKAFVTTAEREAKINAVLERMGIYVKKIKKTKAQIKQSALKETKFHG